MLILTENYEIWFHYFVIDIYAEPFLSTNFSKIVYLIYTAMGLEPTTS